MRTPSWYGQRAPASVAGAPTFTSVTTLSASTHKYGIVFPAPKDGDLDRFGIRIGTVTVAPANGLRFGFQDPDASYDPDETNDAYADVTAGIATNAFLTPTGYMGSTGTGSGTRKSVTAGQIICATIEFTSFTAGDSLQMSQVNPEAAPQTYNVYSDAKVTGAWVKGTNLRGIPIGLLYDGDSEYTVIGPEQYVPYSVFTNETAYGSGSTPDERALRFTVDQDCVINGLFYYCDIDNAADLVLYAGTTPLVTSSLSSANRTAANVGEYRVAIAETSLTAGTEYFLSLKPTTASTVQMRTFSVDSNAHMGGAEGGADWYYAERTDLGSWSPTDTKRPWAGIRIKEYTAAAATEPAYVFVGSAG